MGDPDGVLVLHPKNWVAKWLFRKYRHSLARRDASACGDSLGVVCMEKALTIARAQIAPNDIPANTLVHGRLISKAPHNSAQPILWPALEATTIRSSMHVNYR